MRALIAASLLAAVFTGAAQAMFAMMPADRVSEVPIERLLANIERNAQGLTPAQKARAIGRLHLLAYLRQSEKLAVYRDRPDDVAEGFIGDCATLDEQVLGKGNRNWPKAKPGELCEARTYSLGPRHEVPYVEDKPLSATAHLTAAIDAYMRARELEPENLRTRLALAFAFDRAGRLDEARAELRFVVRKGLDLVPLSDTPGKPKTEWDLHVVLSEAAGHFTLIAEREDDKRMIVELKHRLDLAPPLMFITPIFVPLEANADVSSMIDRSPSVAFDFSGQGERMQLGWLTGKAAWLVWDPHKTGRIDSGFQMFGSVTWIAFWENGYLPLGALDDDGDGKIAGDELSGLALWCDTNSNGISDPGEVKPLGDYKIVALGYAYERAGDTMWIAKAGATFANGEVRPSYDWRLHEAVIRPVAQ
jgi:hypothetical protein